MNQKEAPSTMTTPFDNMSPEKAQFIKQIVSEASGKSQNELFPFLLGINRQIAGKHMSFSDEETDALVSQLTKNLSPKEKKRVELLHQLSKMLHLNVPLTSYVARHSWATTAKEEGVAIAMISEGLGHSSEKVTNVYLASFNNNAMSKANRKVISRIYPKKKKKR